MSRTKVKNFLKTLTQEQLLDVMLELYDARKDARDYLEFYINPDSKTAHEKARKVLFQNYFNNKGKPIKKLNLKGGREIVDNFISLGVDPELKADILMYHLEIYISWLVLRGSINQTAWSAVVSLFRKAVDHIFASGLSDSYSKRVDHFLDYSHHAPKHLRVYERLVQEREEANSNILM